MDRTRNYPSGMAASFPHVMAVELDQPGLPRQPRKRNTKAKEREDSASVVDDRVVDDHLDNDPALAPTTASGSGSDAGAASGSGSQAPGEQGASDDAFDASPFLRSQLGLPPNVPINLDCLEEPRLGEKPNYPYTTLVQLAIYGSPNKRLTLSEIYSTLESRYEWFRDSQDRSKWQVRAIVSDPQFMSTQRVIYAGFYTPLAFAPQTLPPGCTPDVVPRQRQLVGSRLLAGRW